MTRRTNVYQVEFNHRYGYFQEFGQAEKNGRGAYFRIIFETVYSSPIEDISVLQESAQYLAHSNMSIQEEIEFNQKNNNYVIQALLQEKRDITNATNLLYYQYWDENKCATEQGLARLTKLGEGPVFDDRETPQIVRALELNLISNTFKWVLMTPFRELIKVRKSSKGLEEVPPMGQLIALTISRWVEGVGKMQWNDEYCRKIIARNNKEVAHLSDKHVSTSPIKQWIERHDEKESLYCKLYDLLEGFQKTVTEGTTKMSVRTELERLIKGINELQTESAFIETEESESIVQYLSTLLSNCKCNDLMCVVDELRDW